MFNNKYLLYFTIAGLVSLGLVSVENNPIIAQSSADTANQVDSSRTQVSFKSPPDEKNPDRTVGAGSRQDGICSQDATQVPTVDRSSLMALVPTSNYGLTLAERPTFFIALPKTSARQIVLSIRDNGTQHHSQTFLSIADSPGIIKLSFPENASPLEVGKDYQWSVVLVCGEKPGPNDPAIASWVRRIEPPSPLPSELQQENSLAQAIWYGERGLWYDSLTALIQARQAQPDSQVMADIWTNFLTSVGLQKISSEPLRF
jgi:Domain of Unknown Function (DUF928)